MYILSYNFMTRLALAGLKLPASPGDQHGNILRTQKFEHEISRDASDDISWHLVSLVS